MMNKKIAEVLAQMEFQAGRFMEMSKSGAYIINGADVLMLKKEAAESLAETLMDWTATLRDELMEDE